MKSAEQKVEKGLITKLENKGFKNDLFLFNCGYPFDVGLTIRDIVHRATAESQLL